MKTPSFQHLRTIVPVVVLSSLAACQSGPPVAESRPWAEQRGDRLAAWIQREGLVDASPDEIATARTGEIRFEKNKVVVPGSSLVVVFKMGMAQPDRDAEVSQQFTTTSVYEVRSVDSGKMLAKTASSLSTKFNGEIGYKQKVLVSRDGSRLLIYETWCDGAGTHDASALLSKTSAPGKWSVKYLKLPEFTGFEGVEEHGSTPVGFAGDDLLFKPVGSDKICKKKLSEFEEATPPVPFIIG